MNGNTASRAIVIIPSTMYYRCINLIKSIHSMLENLPMVPKLLLALPQLAEGETAWVVFILLTCIL